MPSELLLEPDVLLLDPDELLLDEEDPVLESGSEDLSEILVGKCFESKLPESELVPVADDEALLADCVLYKQ